jgi:hypothetical protein
MDTVIATHLNRLFSQGRDLQHAAPAIGFVRSPKRIETGVKQPVLAAAALNPAGRKGE